MTLQNIFMYVYNLLWRHNCGYLYSEERTTGGFLRMATNKPPCVIIIVCCSQISKITVRTASLMSQYKKSGLLCYGDLDIFLRAVLTSTVKIR